MVSHYYSVCNPLHIKSHFKLMEGQGWRCAVFMSDNNVKSHEKAKLIEFLQYGFSFRLTLRVGDLLSHLITSLLVELQS